MNTMSKLIKTQFQVIKASIRSIETSRATNDLRRNQALLKVWNNTFKWLEDNSRTPWEKSICIAYYGALSSRQCEYLTWDEMKKLALDIMKGEMLL